MKGMRTQSCFHFKGFRFSWRREKHVFSDQDIIDEAMLFILLLKHNLNDMRILCVVVCPSCLLSSCETCRVTCVLNQSLSVCLSSWSLRRETSKRDHFSWFLVILLSRMADVLLSKFDHIWWIVRRGCLSSLRWFLRTVQLSCHSHCLTLSFHFVQTDTWRSFILLSLEEDRVRRGPWRSSSWSGYFRVLFQLRFCILQKPWPALYPLTLGRLNDWPASPIFTLYSESTTLPSSLSSFTSYLCSSSLGRVLRSCCVSSRPMSHIEKEVFGDRMLIAGRLVSQSLDLFTSCSLSLQLIPQFRLVTRESYELLRWEHSNIISFSSSCKILSHL